VALANFQTRRTLVAGFKLSFFAVVTIQGFCQKPSNGRLAAPSGPGKKISVGNQTEGNGVGNGLDNMLLPDDFVE